MNSGRSFEAAADLKKWKKRTEPETLSSAVSGSVLVCACGDSFACEKRNSGKLFEDLRAAVVVRVLFGEGFGFAEAPLLFVGFPEVT